MDGIELLAEIYDVYCECNSQMRKIAGHELLLKMYIIFQLGSGCILWCIVVIPYSGRGDAVVDELDFTENTFYEFILFICDLFNDSVTSSVYVILNGRLTSE